MYLPIMCLHNWSTSKGSLSIWIPEGVKFKVLCQDPGTPLHLMMEVGWLLVKQNVILLFIYAWVSLKVCVWCWFCGMGYWIALFGSLCSLLYYTESVQTLDVLYLSLSLRFEWIIFRMSKRKWKKKNLFSPSSDQPIKGQLSTAVLPDTHL